MDTRVDLLAESDLSLAAADVEPRLAIDAVSKMEGPQGAPGASGAAGATGTQGGVTGAASDQGATGMAGAPPPADVAAHAVAEMAKRALQMQQQAASTVAALNAMQQQTLKLQKSLSQELQDKKGKKVLV